MTKARILSLCSAFLLGPIFISMAQSPDDVNSAAQEAIRREADKITLHQDLDNARAAEKRNDLPTAAKYYDHAWSLVKSIGISSVPTEASQTKSGLIAVRLDLARSAQKMGDLKASNDQLADVLFVDPQNDTAIAMKRDNDKAIHAMQGHVASDEMIAQIPAIQTNKTDAATMVQDGKLLLEMGKYQEAETKLKAALDLDPQNYAAFYYLSLVHDQKYTVASKNRDLKIQKDMVEVVDDWQDPVKRDILPVPNPMAHTNLVYTSKGRQAIANKLSLIHLDDFTVPEGGLPLSEIVLRLNSESRKRDPEKRGINFIIDPNAAAVVAAAPTEQPTPAGLTPPPPSEPVDVASAQINLNPGLSDVRLADVLDAIVRVSKTPIKYSIEDYAVVFSLRSSDAAQLQVRWFKIDPNTFYQGLEAISGQSFGDNLTITAGNGGGGGSSGGGGGRGGGGGGGGGSGGGGTTTASVALALVAGGANGGGGGGTQNPASDVAPGGGAIKFVSHPSFYQNAQTAVRTFFDTMGVNLDPPKNVFFNDKAGVLVVRATAQDLDIIETAVQALNVAPPLVNIKTRFTELLQSDTRALGFDWYLGNTLLNNGTIGAQGGTAPSYAGASSSANPEGTFPGSFLGGTTLSSLTSDGLLTSGLRNTANAPAVGTITGILTDPQFRVVIRALDQRAGVNVLTAPEVTTISGRQAQVQVVDIQSVVEGVTVDQNGSQNNNTATGTTGGGVVGTTITYDVVPLPFGAILDVIPYVSADEYTIHMSIIPKVTEFVGYDDPGGFVPQGQSASSGGGGVGVPITAQLPLPRLRLREVTTSVVVWDGQTVVLGGLLTDSVTKMKDKVPLLGDLPFVGRLWRNESSITEKKNLMIFVTPTIIDPAGNRYHTDEDMPFAQRGFPQQSAATP